MQNRNQNAVVVSCPPCGENVALATKRGAYKAISLMSPSIGPADHFLRKGGRLGFTLIELLVVVLIIGILAAVALPQYNKAVEKSRATQALSLIRAIGTAGDVKFLTSEGNINTFDELDVTIPSDWTGTEKPQLNHPGHKDLSSNGEWTAYIDSQNDWNAVIIARINGNYNKLISFKYAWKSSDYNKSLGLDSGKLFCVEMKTLSPEGIYCEKLFHGKKIAFENAERFYEMP